MVNKILCKIGFHTCDPTDIRFNGREFVSSCKRCGEDIAIAKPTKVFLEHLKAEGYRTNHGENNGSEMLL